MQMDRTAWERNLLRCQGKCSRCTGSCVKSSQASIAGCSGHQDNCLRCIPLSPSKLQTCCKRKTLVQSSTPSLAVSKSFSRGDRLDPRMPTCWCYCGWHCAQNHILMSQGSSPTHFRGLRGSQQASLPGVDGPRRTRKATPAEFSRNGASKDATGATDSTLNMSDLLGGESRWVGSTVLASGHAS